MASSDNYMSRFSPDSHFFTTPASMTQGESQAFGPVSENEFRLTSKFTASGSKAFAICKGVVLVQPQTGDSNKVNVILRPFTQPITGFNIKYFIYRGLQKSDFFLGDQVIVPTTSTSDFINKVNASFLSFNNRINPGVTPPTFMAKFLGYDPLKQTDNLLLSDFFFKESEYVESNGEFIEQEEMAFELPVIEMGASLGNFTSGECGIDIVLNYGDYKLPIPNDEFVFDLAYARTNEAKILLTEGMDDFQKKLKREHIFQFLDAAAYFGFHTDNGTVKVDNAGVKVAKKGLSIYNEVINNFYTKNKLYLYIQSYRTRSYNFYGNYSIAETEGKSLKKGITETALVESAYENKKWPLIIEDTPQAHSESRNKLFLQLVTDNNVNTMLYGQVAKIDNAQHNNFCNADNLRLPDSIDGVPSTLTKILSLSNPAAGSDGAKVNVASFNILLYQGKYYNYITKKVQGDGDGLTDVFAQPNFFDDVFDLVTGVPLLEASDNMAYSVLSSQKLKLINHYYNKMQLGISVVQTNIIKDTIETGDETVPLLKRVTYITEAIDISNESTSDTETVTSDTKTTASISGLIALDKTFILPEPLYYSLAQFTDIKLTITGIYLKTANSTIPNKIILGITEIENNQITELIKTNSLINPRLFLLDLFEDRSQLVSTEGISYQKYKVGIVGEKNTGEVILSLTLPEIIIYSLDRQYHFSKEYSKNMSKWDYIKEDTTITTIE